MKIITDSIRKSLPSGDRIGLVPTMGALHAGHLSLVDAIRPQCDVVVMSIFVNPLQFNNAADLAKYPRTEDADAALAAGVGVDLLWIPEQREIYPEAYSKVFTGQAISLACLQSFVDSFN